MHVSVIIAERRVQPLRAAVHNMWAYLGPIDPTRSHAEELSTSEVKKAVKSLTSVGADDSLDIKHVVLPYEASNPLRKEIISLFFRLYRAYMICNI